MSNEAQRVHSISPNTQLGRAGRAIARFNNESGAALVSDKNKATYENNEKTDGSLASTLKPGADGGLIDVVNKYKWTLSNAELTGEVPYIRLIEYTCNESVISKQTNFYSNIGSSKDTAQEILDVYKGVFSKEHPTDFSYWFPYFSSTGFELRTQQWQALDGAGETLNAISEAASDLLGAIGAKRFQAGLENFTKIGNAAAQVGKTSLQYMNPIVGVFDRPRVFIGHDNRTITISFPLYNTVDENDWKDNRSLIYLLMSQNLFNKRDYITGVPPVFYDVWIPGQYYCYAASMVDIKVDNLGNQRLLYDAIVPDAYYVTLTLQEMVMPSKNQFEAVTNGAAQKFVTSATVKAETDAKEATKEAKKVVAQQYTSNAYSGMKGGF